MTGNKLAQLFKEYAKSNYGYVWSLNLENYTQQKADYNAKIERSCPSGRNPKTYWTVDCKKWIGKMSADCSGGIVGAIRTENPKYLDRSANRFKQEFTESGTINTIPEIQGLAVWRDGHIGIYIGNGEVAEFRGTAYGCVITKLKDRNFTHWGKIKDIEYNSNPTPNPIPIDTESKYAICTGNSVNIREGKGTQYKTLGTVNKNEKLLIIKSDKEWYNISAEIDNKLVTGFMSAKYIKEI